MEVDHQIASLVSNLTRTAKAFLKNQNGEFFPFAAFINMAGEVEMLGADLGVEQPKSTDVINFLRDALTRMAHDGRIKGSGVCVSVGARLPGYDHKVDAICMFVSHAGSPPLDFYVPFRKGFLGYKYDKPAVLPGTMMIFPSTGIPGEG